MKILFNKVQYISSHTFYGLFKESQVKREEQRGEKRRGKKRSGEGRKEEKREGKRQRKRRGEKNKMEQNRTTLPAINRKLIRDRALRNQRGGIITSRNIVLLKCVMRVTMRVD